MQEWEKVRFEKNGINATQVYQFQMRSFYRLSFQYDTQHEDDQIQIAYCVPKSYTKLRQFLARLSGKDRTKDFIEDKQVVSFFGWT